jgi:hypothetical protein
MLNFAPDQVPGVLVLCISEGKSMFLKEALMEVTEEGEVTLS